MNNQDDETAQPQETNPASLPDQRRTDSESPDMAILERRLTKLETEVARATAHIATLLIKVNPHPDSPQSAETLAETARTEAETKEATSLPAGQNTAAYIEQKPPIRFKSPMLQDRQAQGRNASSSQAESKNRQITAAQELQQPDHKDASISDVSTTKNIATESLEARIGLYWLNRIGISVLVIGLALLIAYSFQHFGALVKLLFGFASGALLIGGGEWLDKRRNLSWYARGLSGGGWAIIYFTTYAMHFIPSVAILSSQTVDLILLLTVAAGSMAHSVYKNSELSALLGIMLGLITLAIAEPNALSAATSGILTLSAAILAIKTGWTRFLTWTCLSAYFTFNFLSISEKLGTLALQPDQALLFVLSYTGIYWISYTIATCFIKKATQDNQSDLVKTATLNAFGFLYSLFPWMEKAFPGEFQYVLLFMGIIYATTLHPSLRKTQLKAVSITHSLLALLFCTLYIPAALKELNAILVMSIEVALLTFIGLKYDLRSFRWFALPLSTSVTLGTLVNIQQNHLIHFSGITFPSAFFATFLCSLCLAFSAFSYKQAAAHDSLTEERKNVGFYWHYLGSLFTAWLLPITLTVPITDNAVWLTNTMSQSIQLFFWACLLYANTQLAWVWRKQNMMILSWLMATIIANCALAFHDAHWLASTGALLSLYVIPFKIKSGWNKQALVDFSLLLTSGSLWLYTIIHFHGQELSALLAIEALSSLYLSKKLNSTVGEFIACFWFASAAFSVVPSENQHWLSTLAIVSSLYAAAYSYWQPSGSDEYRQTFLRLAYGISGTLVLTCMLANLLPNIWVSSAWTIEASALLVFGFLVRRKAPRIGGLIIFALVILKLLLWDMAYANTLLRITSFIGAGLLLLLFSFIYAHFSAKMLLSKDKS